MIELAFRAPVTETPTIRRFFDYCFVARDPEDPLQLLPRSEVSRIESLRQLEILTPGKHQLTYLRRVIVEGLCGGRANFKRDGANALGEQFPDKLLRRVFGDFPVANAAALQFVAAGGRCRGADCHKGAGLA